MPDYIAVDKVKTDAEYDSYPLDDESLIRLAKDIEIQKQIQPIIINSDFEIVDGRRRLKAIKEILKLSKIKYDTKDVKGDYLTLASISANIYAHRYSDHELMEKTRQMTHLMKKLYPLAFQTGPKNSDKMSGIPEKPIKQVSDAIGQEIRTVERKVAMLDNIVEGLRETLINKEIKWTDIKTIGEWGKEHQEKIVEALKNNDKKHQVWEALEEGPTALWQLFNKQEVREPRKHIERPIIDIREEKPICLSDMGITQKKLSTITRMAKEGMTWDSIYTGFHPKNGLILVKWLRDGETLTPHQWDHWFQIQEIIKGNPKYKGTHLIQFENNDPYGVMYWNGRRVTRNMEEAILIGTSKELQDGFEKINER